jgi:hypothetical protein
VAIVVGCRDRRCPTIGRAEGSGGGESPRARALKRRRSCQRAIATRARVRSNVSRRATDEGPSRSARSDEVALGQSIFACDRPGASRSARRDEVGRRYLSSVVETEDVRRAWTHRRTRGELTRSGAADSFLARDPLGMPPGGRFRHAIKQGFRPRAFSARDPRASPPGPSSTCDQDNGSGREHSRHAIDGDPREPS